MAAINYDGLNAYSVLYTTGSAGATINVQSQAANLLTIIGPGTGDTVNISSPSRTMDGLQGALRVQSAAGQTPTVNIDDSRDSNPKSITLASDGANGYLVNGLLPGDGLTRGRMWLQLDPAAPVTISTGPAANVFKARNFVGAPALALNARSGSGLVSTLDYSTYTGDVTVDLPLGSATGFRAISGIWNVAGSIGNNILVGDANPNVLVGGTGRNLIIGGKGADQLVGGNLDNILIAGYTLFDQDPNLFGLRAIMDAWLSGDTFDKRVKAIGKGVVGKDGKVYALLGGSGKDRTVFDDGARDVLTCTANPDPGLLDWLFANLSADPTIADLIVNAKKKDLSYEVPLFPA
jgi:hypothetical protein